eukprot:5130857-Prymnesium_polylepis.1
MEEHGLRPKAAHSFVSSLNAGTVPSCLTSALLALNATSCSADMAANARARGEARRLWCRWQAASGKPSARAGAAWTCCVERGLSV